MRPAGILVLGSAGLVSALLFTLATRVVASGEDSYHDLATLEDQLQRHAKRGAAVEFLDLGPTSGGRSVPALRLGAPGEVPLAERPTVWILGGADGRSLAGGEAVLAIIDDLLETPNTRSDLAVVALPWCSPDALTRALAGDRSGLDDASVDLDGDGHEQEDGPDDLDGDGRVLTMLVEDPQGSWTLGDDPRFPMRAQPGQEPRYRLVPEGRDDDGDGRFNEDGPGGYAFDQAFPLGWTPGAERGSTPLEHPVAARLAEAIAASRPVAVLVIQGSHGSTRWPQVSAEDQAVAERLARSVAWHTRRRTAGAPAGPADGALIDWAWHAAGAFAIEVAPWGPEGLPQPAPTDGGAARSMVDPLAAGIALDARSRAWSRWLDDTQAGIGFVPWHPVDLPGGVRALVGGLEPGTLVDPPAGGLAAALEGLPACARALVEGAPRLELTLREARREGELIFLSARIANIGHLPTSPEAWSRRHGRGADVQVELELVPGARLVEGQQWSALGRLPAGATRLRTWVIHAPRGASLAVKVSAARCASVREEVRP